MSLVERRCPVEHLHTPAPTDYREWHEWATRMAKTHRQQKCPGCGRWRIWLKKEPGQGQLQREGGEG